MKNSKFIILLCLLLALFSNSCKKQSEPLLKQDLNQETITAKKKKTTSYIDVVYISNESFTTTDNGLQGYDNMGIYHTNLNNNIRVYYTATNSAHNQVHSGPGSFVLGGSADHATWDLSPLYYSAVSRHSNTGYFIDDFTFTITDILDENGNNIRDQVQVIPEQGVVGSTKASLVYFTLDTTKAGGGEGH
jgi:hypothetical protein